MKGGLLPSLITHTVVAVAAGKSLAHGEMSAKFWMLSILCSVLPDADVIAFFLGVPYGHFFGHRGFFHSIFFGLLLGSLVVTLFFRQEPFGSQNWWILLAYFSLLTASHGILDALTSGGLGIALLSPFDSTRYFFPFTPIQVSPISVRAFISMWGVRVMASEFLWVWIPALTFLMIFRFGIRPSFFPRV